MKYNWQYKLLFFYIFRWQTFASMWLWHPLRPDIVPRWGNRRSRGRRWPRWGESNIVSQRRRKATSIATTVEAIIAWGSIRWYVDQWAIWAKMSSMSVLIDRTWPLTPRCWRRWSRSSSSWSSKTTSTLYWIYWGNINVGYIIVFFIYGLSFVIANDRRLYLPLFSWSLSDEDLG